MRHLSIAALAIFFAQSAVAQTYQGKELVKASLVADTSAIIPGKPFSVGLLLRMAPDWHTYWKYSGDAGLPTDQIKTTVDNALTVLRDPKLKPAAKLKDRRDQLKQILFARFDFTEMAKRALGAHWRRRTPQEQEEFVRLFTEVLERAYADIIESYTDEKIVYVNERVDGTYAELHSLSARAYTLPSPT